MKCALIEYNSYHGETLPTLVHILNRLNISVDVYCSQKVIRNNPFIYAAGLSYSQRDCDGLFFKLWVARRQFRDYDFLLLNSLEPKEILQKAAEVSIPIVAVIHNGNLINTDLDFARFFAVSNRKPLVLAKHISDFVSKAVATQWISPVFFGQVKARKVHDQTNVLFCVQGNLDFDRRNYVSLLDAIEQLASDGVRSFRVMIVGRSEARHYLIFREQVRDRKLDSFFEFSNGELTYQDYYGSMTTASFLLPLVDRTSTAYRAYFLDKITSSVQLAIGLGIVPVIHMELARLYEIEEQSVAYRDGGLTDALKRALNINAEALEPMRNGLVSKKETLLNESIANMRDTLQDIGLTPPRAKVAATNRRFSVGS